MKLFGWRRQEARPALSTYGSRAGGVAMGEWPPSYEAQVREGYGRNAIAQRAVKLVADAIGNAPVVASEPALLALVQARSGGQALLETVAAQLQLHGKARRSATCCCSRAGRRRRTWRSGFWAGSCMPMRGCGA